MKTYQEFITEAPTEAEAAKIAPGISPEKRRAALERNARRQAARDTPTTQKKQLALPAGNQGGGLVQRSSQGTSITKRDTGKSGGLVKKTFGKPVKSSGSSELANTGVKKVNVKVDKPRPERPGTTRTTKDSDDGDWGKDIPDWKDDSGSKNRRSNVTNVNIDNTDKEKGGPCSGHRAKFNPFCKKSDDKLGTADGGTDGKDRSNSQI